MAKERIVSKKELEASGLELRDFLNKERGLTRKPPEGITREPKSRREPKPLTEVVKPGTNINYENTETSDMTFKKGGKVSSASARADGCAMRGKTKGRII